ncbi:EamA-like transporter family protein [Variibacter gotjawalensis]|uniref:EamA-like transporter family protein n=1 Tax=Variibacter gotjawalensis TaxID=1333996 RepID=A0A0S3PQV3_9BRAD|nr:DMT family transporter [Variibacter gotjawalensis]NIK48570.1 drug/metabolite transporter (DMT)-like permease [Variibacter gotjawalensis]RZS50435.1 EamA domain-containing membrane protein RarD [Variibacter gotjawalensis]BAT58269.1 EamA-like transporter family protein [Variibacter gotjawalensis]
MTTSELPAGASLRRNATLVGIALMMLGVFLYSLNDALGKYMLATYSVGQMLLIRASAALIVLSPFIWTQRAAFGTIPRPGLQLVRVFLSTAEVVMFFWAVTYLPLADTVTYYLAGPIYVTALSPILLREHVGWRRWTAVVIGFVGVIITLNPSPATLTLPAIIALFGSFFFAMLMIATRHLRGTPDIVMATSQIGATWVLAAFWAPIGWIAPTLVDMSLMALLGVVAVVAMMSVNRSLKLAPASVVVPYQYMLIVWAVILGYLVFNEVPKIHVIVGSLIIVLAGLYIFWREQANAKEPLVEQPPG